jgi:hypothetical protein
LSYQHVTESVWRCFTSQELWYQNAMRPTVFW